MAKELSPQEKEAAEAKKQIQEEKKKFKKEQADAKKAAKARAREIAKQEEEYDDEHGGGGGFVTFLATLFIVLLWLAVICVIIKLDVGGFGSSVLTPILKDVPVVNRILPKSSQTITGDPENYGGYSNLQDAVNQIYALELQLEAVTNANKEKDEQITALQSEVTRLSEFEQKQADFQRIWNEFAEEVVYAENGPGPEEYRKFYEEMNPESAEFLYKQVVGKLTADAEWNNYVLGYASMEPKQAAAAFEEMTDNDGIALVARILSSMNAENRAKIMDAMADSFVARITKLMDPGT